MLYTQKIKSFLSIYTSSQKMNVSPNYINQGWKEPFLKKSTVWWVLLGTGIGLNPGFLKAQFDEFRGFHELVIRMCTAR